MDIQVDFCFLWVTPVNEAMGNVRFFHDDFRNGLRKRWRNRTGGNAHLGGKFCNSGIGLGRSLDQTLVTCRNCRLIMLMLSMDEFCNLDLNTWKPWWWFHQCFYMCSPRKIGGRWTHFWRMFFRCVETTNQAPFWVHTDDLEKELSWFSSLLSIAQSVFRTCLSRCHDCKLLQSMTSCVFVFYVSRI